MSYSKLSAVTSVCALAALAFVPISRQLRISSRTLSPFGFGFSRAARPVAGEIEADQNLRRSHVTLAEAQAARWRVTQQVTPESRERQMFAFSFPGGDRVEFNDRPRRRGETARRDRVIYYSGTLSAADTPEAKFVEATRRTQLPDEAGRALRFVSQHEGGFDAVNTWDRARFSWGFIQFAGGRGFPKLLAHFKSQDPQLFHTYLGQYGVDVLPGDDGEPTPVCLDTMKGRVLYGDRAEQRIGDDPLLVALFIRAGRDADVQRLQIEAACRLYVRPALKAQASGVVLSTVLRSPKGMAMLIDRKIHEGNCMRLARAIDGVRSEVGFFDLAYSEARVLLRAVRDSWNSGRTTVSERLQNIYYSNLPGPA